MMMNNLVESFKASLLEIPDFIDEEGVMHHEFKRGSHGRKMDFGMVKKGMPEYDAWVMQNKHAIRERYSYEHELYIVGVETGTTQLAFDVAEALGNFAVGLRTEKLPDNSVRLSESAKLLLGNYMQTSPASVVVLEDVGTTGFTSGNVVLETQRAGAEFSEVQITWKRSTNLQFLDEHSIKNYTIIDETVPSMPPEECELYGDCSKGVRLVQYGR